MTNLASRLVSVLLPSVLLLAVRAGPLRAETISLDLANTPFRAERAVRRFSPTASDQGTMHVQLRGSLEDNPDKSGELLFDLRGSPLVARPWGNRTRVSAEVRVAPVFVGEGKRNWHRAHRARLFLQDALARRQYLPYTDVIDRPKASDGWLTLAGRTTVEVPMPLGFTEDGFDPDHVAKLGVSVEAFNRPDEVVTGIIELRNLRVAFGPRVPSAVLPPDRKILAGETTRAAAMRARLRARLGDATAGHMAFGVNLAWATARSAEGEDLQLYGRLLDAGTPWGNVLWDLGTPAVVDSLRADFRAISATFGPRPLIRLWLFADMRSGISFDARGMPLGISKRAEANMRVLLRLARDENVRLLPVLLDFGIADGVEHSGPDAAWTVGEHLDVVTDAAKRTRLAALFEAFVRLFRDDPAVVAWEVMNEPENAAAAVTPEHFADLQRLLATLVDAVHRAGELATIGHRNPIDARRFMRGRVATDLGQAHHYPMLETRPNPSLFGTRMGDVFGALPAGWGECQVRPQAVAEQVGAARAAGHSFLLFWSWRGDQDSGDGFAVKPYADEIKRAVRALKQGDDARHAP